MGAMLDELLGKNFWLYIVFHIAGVMLRLVNNLESYFARTLVACDVPMSANSTFTGSSYCGDRLYVINEGQKLSSVAQGYEATFKVMALLFVSVMADLVGRKPALVLGLTCTATSTILFATATVIDVGSAQWLFTIGQGLQGAYPADLLGSIVTTDTSNEPGADIILMSTLNQIISVILSSIVDVLGTTLGAMEILDFRPLWLIITVINLSVAVAAVLCCRETKPDFGEGKKSLLEGVRAELKEYGQLMWSSRLLRMNLVVFGLMALCFACDNLCFSFVIARHGMRQSSAALWFFFSSPVAVLCIGLVGGMSEKYGEKQVFLKATLLITLLDVVFYPLYPVTSWAVFIRIYGYSLLSGVGPLDHAVSSRWFDQRVTAKFFSMKMLTTYCVGMMAHPIAASLFDAKATTYFGSLRPFVLALTCKLAAFCIWRYVVWDMGAEGGLSSVLDGIEKENAELRAKKASVEASAEQKKTD